MEPSNPLLDEYVLGLCRRKKPKVCFFPSASGDADHYVVRFYRHFSSEKSAIRRMSRCSDATRVRARCASTCSSRT